MKGEQSETSESMPLVKSGIVTHISVQDKLQTVYLRTNQHRFIIQMLSPFSYIGQQQGFYKKKISLQKIYSSEWKKKKPVLYMKRLYFASCYLQITTRHTVYLKSDDIRYDTSEPHGLKLVTRPSRVPSAHCSCAALKLILRWEPNKVGKCFWCWCE